MLDLKMLKMDTIQNKKKTQQLWDCVHDDHKLSNKFIHFYSVPFPSSIWLFPCHHLWQHIWACAKRCSVRTIHFFGCKCFFMFKFSLNKPNFIRKSMHQRDNKDKLDSQSQFCKIWKFTQVRAENRQRKGGHFRCTASVVVLFASFFFR